MLEAIPAALKKLKKGESEESMVLFEMTINQLLNKNEILPQPIRNLVLVTSLLLK